MGIYCVLCGRKDKSVSYIRFPSNEDIMRRKQWLKFCKKSEKNLYDSHRLCTDHFKPEDLRKRLKCIVVQPEAVPCIYRKTDGNICFTGITSNDSSNDNINVVNYSQSTTETETMSKQMATIIAHNNDHPYHRTVITHTSCNQITSSCGTPRKSQDFAKEDTSGMDVDVNVDPGMGLRAPIEFDQSTSNVFLLYRFLYQMAYSFSNFNSIGAHNPNADVDVDPAYYNGIGNCEIPLNNCLTPLKRQKDAHCSNKKKLKFHSTELVSNDSIDSTIPMHESPKSALTSATCDSSPPMIPNPRYVGDIRLSHLATPRRAERAMNVIRRTVMQQRKKIETLQKQFSRCKQRISSLKDLVSDLKKKNYISETAVNNLMVRLNDIYRSKAPNKTSLHR